MYRGFFLSFPPLPPPFCERKKKKSERRKERQESSALETLFVSFLNYYVTCKRSGGVGSGLGESARIDVPHEQPWSLFAISIDRLSRFLPLETLEFRLPRKISHRGCIAKSLASPMKRAISDPFLDEKGQVRSARFTILVTAGLISSAARFFPSLSLLVYKYYESVNGKWLIRPEGKKRDFLRANMARVTMHD